MSSVRLKVSGLTLDVPGRRLLDNISFASSTGECVAVVGPSGSGKTSLLNCLCGIATPTSGLVQVEGTEVNRLGLAKRTSFRLRQIGMVFQFGELLPEMTVLENVALPLRLMDFPRREADTRAASWLDRLGIGDLGGAHPDILSGGEAQRAGIARALAHEPILVLADEPTGALDEGNSSLIAELLASSSKSLGATVLVATHDPFVAAKADRVLKLRGGRLVSSAESGDVPRQV